MIAPEQIDVWRSFPKEMQYCAFQSKKNKTLRERFVLSESSTYPVSQIIAATMEAGLIKLDPNAPTSRKYARSLPIWA